ncbi:Scr1 family TA system antitoxin-like transcriptional regulator [Salinispora arenicola]|uniref:Scr1 family TA system antitoxin-like transcriptional regulator n=1 Tax=Salinispora arenicola TaxID=168697 RepID=UPI0034660B19
MPRSGFSIYTYPDDDPTIVAVDTVTDDLILTKPADVAHYLTLYDRLVEAALSGDQSLRLLRETADTIPQRTGQAA